ncbi:MAG: glycosyltransferase [Bacteroidales bacterium]|nr:glycosyltransferase [Bacteroidales bacterium]
MEQAKKTDKISVITICFNNLFELIETIKSVDNQIVKPFQHFIVDGSTNSEIRDYLSKNPQPNYRQWFSELDKGIADAFNKGILACSGNIVNMLNSGDCYASSNVIEHVLSAFQNDENLMWVYGKAFLMKGDQRVLVGKLFEPQKLYRGMRSISHQTMFFKKTLHDRHGLYDQSLKIAMDYDFVCRIAFEKSKFIEIPMAEFQPGGISSNYFEALKETKKIYEAYYGYSIKLFFWQLRLKILHILLQTKLGLLLNRIKIWFKLENL